MENKANVSRHKISLKVNGQRFELEVEGNRLLVDLIREDLTLTGTKRGCDRGDCGLCTVLMDGKPVKSCLILAVEADGKEITTIEGLAEFGRLTGIQKSFIQHGAIQCGFCTPAFVLAAEALLERNPHPTEKEVKEAISGILCRCTGYRQIIQAILETSKTTK